VTGELHCAPHGHAAAGLAAGGQVLDGEHGGGVKGDAQGRSEGVAEGGDWEGRLGVALHPRPCG
jgi:hypothetical protein